MAWELDFTDEAESWLLGLSNEDFRKVSVAIDRLEEEGPMLGRPTVDRIQGSRHHNMKELRSTGGNLRVLFAFDQERHAILLVGGNKTDDWTGWYDRNIPVADRLYDGHLTKLTTHRKE